MKAKKLLILNRIHDIDQIKSIIKENEIEIYSLNFSVHSILNENKIPHVMSEELLTEDDLNKIFDKTAALYGWHDNIEKNKIPKVIGFENNNLTFYIEHISIKNALKFKNAPIKIRRNDPFLVNKGTPIKIASRLVVIPGYGNVSKIISI